MSSPFKSSGNSVVNRSPRITRPTELLNTSTTTKPATALQTTSQKRTTATALPTSRFSLSLNPSNTALETNVDLVIHFSSTESDNEEEIDANNLNTPTALSRTLSNSSHRPLVLSRTGSNSRIGTPSTNNTPSSRASKANQTLPPSTVRNSIDQGNPSRVSLTAASAQNTPSRGSITNVNINGPSATPNRSSLPPIINSAVFTPAKRQPTATSAQLQAAKKQVVDSICTYIRIRPQPKGKSHTPLIPYTTTKDTFTLLQDQAVLHNTPTKPKDRQLTYTKVLESNSDQQDIFHDTIGQVDIRSFASAQRNLIGVCYGQSNSGKSYTAFGDIKTIKFPDPADRNTAVLNGAGLVPRSAYAIFAHLPELYPTTYKSITIKMTLIEMMSKDFKSLLDTDGSLAGNFPLDKIPTLYKSMGVEVKDFKHSLEVLDTALKRRETSATNQNATSSRTHCCVSFSIHVPSLAMSEYCAENRGDVPQGDNNNNIHDSRLEYVAHAHFFDLCGSEKVNQNDPNIQCRGIDINSSLSAFQKWIADRTAGSPNAGRESSLTYAFNHFYESFPAPTPLTLLLPLTERVSLIKFIGCVNLEASNAVITRSTLEYTSQVKQIKQQGSHGSSLNNKGTQDAATKAKKLLLQQYHAERKVLLRMSQEFGIIGEEGTINGPEYHESQGTAYFCVSAANLENIVESGQLDHWEALKTALFEYVNNNMHVGTEGDALTRQVDAEERAQSRAEQELLERHEEIMISHGNQITQLRTTYDLQLAAAQDRITAQENQIAELQAQLFAQRSVIQQQQNTIGNIYVSAMTAQKFNSAGTDDDDVTTHLPPLLALKQLRTKVTQLKQDTSDLQQLREQNVKLSSEKAQVTQQYFKCRNYVIAGYGHFRQLEDDYDNLHDYYNHLEKQCAAQQKQHASELLQRTTKFARFLKQLSNQRKKLQAKYQRKLKSMTDRLENSEYDKDELSKEIETSNTQITFLNDILATQQDEKKTMKNEIDDLKELMMEQRFDLQKLQGQIEQKDATIAEAGVDYTALYNQWHECYAALRLAADALYNSHAIAFPLLIAQIKTMYQRLLYLTVDVTALATCDQNDITTFPVSSQEQYASFIRAFPLSLEHTEAAQAKLYKEEHGTDILPHMTEECQNDLFELSHHSLLWNMSALTQFSRESHLAFDSSITFEDGDDTIDDADDGKKEDCFGKMDALLVKIGESKSILINAYNSAKQRAAKATAEYNEMCTEMEQMQNECDELRERLAQEDAVSLDQINTLMMAQLSLESQLKDKDSTITALTQITPSQSIDELQSKFSHVSAELSALQDQHALLTTTKNTFEVELAAARTKFDDVLTQLSSLTASHATLQAENITLSKQHAGLSAQHNELSTQYHQVSAQRDELSIQCDGLSVQVTSLSSQLTIMQDEIATISVQHTTTTNALSFAQTELLATTTARQKLQKECTTLQDIITHQKSLMSTQETSINSLTVRNDELSASRDQDAKELSTQISKLKSNYIAAKDLLEADIFAITVEKDALLQQIAEEHKDKMVLQETLTTLKVENFNLSEQNSQLLQQITVHTAQNMDLSQKIIDLEQLLSKLREAKIKLEADNRTLIAQLELQCTESVSQLREQLEELTIEHKKVVGFNASMQLKFVCENKKATNLQREYDDVSANYARLIDQHAILEQLYQNTITKQDALLSIEKEQQQKIAELKQRHEQDIQEIQLSFSGTINTVVQENVDLLQQFNTLSSSIANCEHHYKCELSARNKTKGGSNIRSTKKF